MEEAFPVAGVEGWEKKEPDMGNDPKDRNVVAAAVAAEATVIVTSNIRDFSNLPDGIVAMTLMNSFRKSSRKVQRRRSRQSRLKQPRTGDRR